MGQRMASAIDGQRGIVGAEVALQVGLQGTRNADFGKQRVCRFRASQIKAAVHDHSALRRVGQQLLELGGRDEQGVHEWPFQGVSVLRRVHGSGCGCAARWP